MTTQHQKYRVCLYNKTIIAFSLVAYELLYHDWFGFLRSRVGYIYISRIDSLGGSLTPSARSYRTLQLHALTNNTFVNLTSHGISRLYTSTSVYNQLELMV